jgi:hypothetical protein
MTPTKKVVVNKVASATPEPTKNRPMTTPERRKRPFAFGAIPSRDRAIMLDDSFDKSSADAPSQKFEIEDAIIKA